MPNKRKGRHRHKALSDRFIREKLEPGKYADGNGLYLIVDESGWVVSQVQLWFSGQRSRPVRKAIFDVECADDLVCPPK